jgi:trimethylamine---corrinoid protein Co-methyltransferase
MDDQVKIAFKEALKSENAYDFEGAKAIYADLIENVSGDALMEKVRWRMQDMDDLIAEKKIYARIDENGKRVLTDIGINIVENQTLMDILMEADAIDFDNETAIFIPLKRAYIDRCLEQIPRQMPADPGMNAFGTGATPPFLKRATDDELRAANRKEYEQITETVGEHQDVVGIFSLPVANDKSISLFEVAQLMERDFSGLKMMATNHMSDDEVKFLKGKDDWVDGTSLITSLTPMKTMVEPFLRSVRTGNNLLLLDLTIAGMSGGGSPESLLTQIHAQVMFMMVVAQTINPGVFCMHGGIPGVAEAGGDLSYSSPHQPLINAAMARLNMWVSGFASAQSGGSTSLTEVTLQSVSESESSRNSLRKYGAHVVRHAMGALGSLVFFSLEKFMEDCERERCARHMFEANPNGRGVIPMYFPADDEALAGIREIAEKGNPKSADHTLKNVDSFRLWEAAINKAARKKLVLSSTQRHAHRKYQPVSDDSVIAVPSI